MNLHFSQYLGPPDEQKKALLFRSAKNGDSREEQEEDPELSDDDEVVEAGGDEEEEVTGDHEAERRRDSNGAGGMTAREQRARGIEWQDQFDASRILAREFAKQLTAETAPGGELFLYYLIALYTSSTSHVDPRTMKLLRS